MSDEMSKEAKFGQAVKKVNDMPWKDILMGGAAAGGLGLGGGAMAHSVGTQDQLRKNIERAAAADARTRAVQKALGQMMQKNYRQDRGQQRAIKQLMAADQQSQGQEQGGKQEAEQGMPQNRQA